MIDYLKEVLFWIGLETVLLVSGLWLMWQFAKFLARAQLRRKAKEG